MLYEDKMVDVSDFDRVMAIIVAKGKVYVSDCDHQEALELLCEDLGKSTGLDWSDPNKYDEVHEKAVKLTDELFLENKIQGFSAFIGEEDKLYIIAHYPANLETAIESLKEYTAQLGNFIFGTFVGRSDKAMLLAL